MGWEIEQKPEGILKRERKNVKSAYNLECKYINFS